VIGAGAPQQLLEGHILRLVLALGQLLQHHLPFHGEVVVGEAWFEHQLQQ